MQSFDLAPVDARSLWWSLSIAGAIALVLVLAVAGAVLLLTRPRIEIAANGLRIASPVFGRTIPLSRLDLGAARRIDLAATPDLQPKWRTMGIGLPGYKAGWFRLQNGDKALLFVTNPADAVYVPTRDDYALIVTPADPAALLGALKAASR